MSDIIWGLGIEHETMLLNSNYENVSGKQLIQKLNPQVFGTKPYILNIIKPESNYEVYLADSYKYTKLYPFIRIEFLETLLTDMDFAMLMDEYYDIVAPSEYLVNLDDWIQNIDDSAPPSIYQDSDNRLRLYRLLIRYLLNNLDTDRSTSKEVLEFKNKQFQNKSISWIINDINIQQKIVVYLLNHHYNNNFIYPLTGSVFPLNCRENYCLDYTGSYHLNLSLPYSQVVLIKEEERYHRYHNTIKEKITIFLQQYQKKNNLEKINDIITNHTRNKIFNFLNNLLHNRFNYGKELKDLEDVFQVRRELLTNVKPGLIIIEPFDRFMSTGDFLEPRPPHLFTFSIYLDKYPSLFYSLGENDPGYETILKLSLKYENAYILALLPNNQVELYSRDSISLSTSYTKNDILNLEPVLTLPLTLPQTLKNNLNTALNKNVTPIQETIDIKIAKINEKYNLYQKYKGGFHYLHKNWAIAIQFLLPIILACFSSCDPISVNNYQKLTELSLRLFISGYSFINFCNVHQYGIPEHRSIHQWQEIPLLAKFNQSKLPYTHGNKRGSEYRTSPEHGFQFGFEIRVFDNFLIEHAEVLIELLIFLADHLYHKGIIHKDFNINPYNHPIINHQIKKIIFNGWNTTLDEPYLKLISKVLEIPISVNDSNPESKYAYHVCNNIYQFLQNKYKNKDGNGIGFYSQYMVKNSQKHVIPNINRFSWESNFYQLLYQHDSNLRKLIRESLKKPKLDLMKQLEKTILPKYNINILDLYYYLSDSTNQL